MKATGEYLMHPAGHTAKAQAHLTSLRREATTTTIRATALRLHQANAQRRFRLLDPVPRRAVGDSDVFGGSS